MLENTPYSNPDIFVVTVPEDLYTRINELTEDATSHTLADLSKERPNEALRIIAQIMGQIALKSQDSSATTEGHTITSEMDGKEAVDGFAKNLLTNIDVDADIKEVNVQINIEQPRSLRDKILKREPKKVPILEFLVEPPNLAN